jgi:hypothetical protein
MRLLFTVTLLLTLLFAACIGLIRAQPYDDMELRAFLAPPEGCPAPCFMGIRPGVTSAEEAIAILEGHDWIDTVSRYEATEGVGLVSLTATWSGRQPDLIDNVFVLWLSIRENTITNIYLRSRIPLGRIHLLLGAPDLSQAFDDSLETSSTTVSYLGEYHDLDLFFLSLTPCPIKSVWTLPVQWWLSYDAAIEDQREIHDAPSQMYQICRSRMNGG